MKDYIINGKGLIISDSWQKNCWVNIEIPTPEDKKYIIEELGVPESFYNDIEDLDERPRIELEDGWTLIILRIPIKTMDIKIPFATIPLGLIFKEDIFVSICSYKTDMVNDFIAYTQRKNIQKDNNYNFALNLLLSSSVWFLKYLKQINLFIKSAEERLEKSIKNEELQILLQIEKCLVYFTTSLKGNDILIHRIKNLRINKDILNEELLEDVEIEQRQALETTKIYSDILSGMMDAYASVISNNLNVIMKQLTFISIVLMIPTLIASLYGMNVPNFMEDSKFAFFFVVLISFIISIIGILLFKRKKWL
ncbi:MAG TPA: magnesium transporter CorA family protein [Candidatus Kapabacteria bacterium]|nr:magnesium transporter CorA family protein [Candidatus Kapabacteria bacterium]HPO62089.1 magnesium transporter CorA family protein [Candidatus Kapabacteria bacterium]